eukprot:361291-Chlamydomonas_euryale.AAC.5
MGCSCASGTELPGGTVRTMVPPHCLRTPGQGCERRYAICIARTPWLLKDWAQPDQRMRNISVSSARLVCVRLYRCNINVINITYRKMTSVDQRYAAAMRRLMDQNAVLKARVEEKNEQIAHMRMEMLQLRRDLNDAKHDVAKLEQIVSPEMWLASWNPRITGPAAQQELVDATRANLFARNNVDEGPQDSALPK